LAVRRYEHRKYGDRPIEGHQHGVGIIDQASAVRQGHDTCDLAAEGESRSTLVQIILLVVPNLGQAGAGALVDYAIADLCPWRRIKP
jgi:hypothetical protein